MNNLSGNFLKNNYLFSSHKLVEKCPETTSLMYINGIKDRNIHLLCAVIDLLALIHSHLNISAESHRAQDWWE